MARPTNDEPRFEVTVQLLAALIATRIIDNAKDNDEDPLKYSTDEEVVELYMDDMVSDVSKVLGGIFPKMVEISQQSD